MRLPCPLVNIQSPVDDSLTEIFGERRNRAGRFIESDALHAVHREEEGWKARALLIRAVDLVDEMIEGVEIDAANGDSRRVDGEKFTPQFFLRGMQADDDDGMRVHDFTFPAYRISRRRFRNARPRMREE